MMTRLLAPPTIARNGANPPMMPTSASPPSTAAVPTGPEAMKTNLTSSPFFLKIPASLAIHMGAIEATGAHTARFAAVDDILNVLKVWKVGF